MCLTEYGNGRERTCISTKATTKVISVGQMHLMERKTQTALLLMVKNILSCHYSSRHTAGETAKAYSTTRKKQTQFFTMQSTAKIPCGTRAIISYDLSVAARSVIHHITYRTSMTYSLCGLMKRIPIFGAKQPEQAERTL